MITSIKTVAVYVTDQQRALEFYTGKLGFEVRRNQPMGPGGNWVEVSPPGSQTCVVLYPRAMMAGWESLKPSVVFGSEDIAATHGELSARGVSFTQAPATLPWGTYAKFTDPD